MLQTTALIWIIFDLTDEWLLLALNKQPAGSLPQIALERAVEAILPAVYSEWIAAFSFFICYKFFPRFMSSSLNCIMISCSNSFSHYFVQYFVSRTTKLSLQLLFHAGFQLLKSWKTFGLFFKREIIVLKMTEFRMCKDVYVQSLSYFSHIRFSSNFNFID